MDDDDFKGYMFVIILLIMLLGTAIVVGLNLNDNIKKMQIECVERGVAHYTSAGVWEWNTKTNKVEK